MSDEKAVPRRPSRRNGRASSKGQWATRALFSVAAVGAIQFVHAPKAPRAPFANLSAASNVWASPDAFGESREVKVRFAMPGDMVEFPLAVSGDPAALAYQWVPLGDTVAVDSATKLAGATVTAPARPGFYHLVLLRRGDVAEAPLVKETMVEPTLAVMVPFAQKAGGLLNGYRIGTYLAERLGVGGRHERPEGFLEVQLGEIDLPVSKHFRLSDFITHDTQRDVWPKYVALNPRLLDKLELVVAEIARRRGLTPDAELALGVHSGFRTPAYNANVKRAASDSRHQYGDAADVVIDADGDGRITSSDSKLVASAVETVEMTYPDLVGGLGLYTSRRYRTPYVHIDARGKRSRWRG
jgi:uncharacterized protein YcbK (DUF882 family)